MAGTFSSSQRLSLVNIVLLCLVFLACVTRHASAATILGGRSDSDADLTLDAVPKRAIESRTDADTGSSSELEVRQLGQLAQEIANAASPVIKDILKNSTIGDALSQMLTNGASILGTLNAPALLNFIGAGASQGSQSASYPWGGATAANTNPYEQSPTTGVVRNYDFTIARGNIAPDGVNKSVLLINGAFPAPLLEANWGDTFQITVHNAITGPEEGVALHWHGILQRQTPWFDGVPGVQQCPIAPGKSMTYKFKADLYGSSWYHSHYSAQYAGGLFGPMVIHGPSNAFYDIDIGPVVLSDWVHQDYFSVVEEVVGLPGNPAPSSDNNLINGKMNFDCSTLQNSNTQCTPNAGLAKFNFKSGKKHRLRLINTSAEAIQRFTIDNHTMTIIANDFVPVQPYQTSMVTLGVGQRTDVIVEAKLPPASSVFMRSDISKTCSLSTQPNALAVIYYEKANKSATPTTLPTPYDDSVCGNDPLDKTTPFFPFPATKNPAVTQDLTITFGQNSTGHFIWSVNNSTFRVNYNFPILPLANMGNFSYPNDPQWNVYNFNANSSVRIIIKNTFFVAHPMHLHGHNFNVLAEGVGEWDGTVKHIRNTQRRDVQLLQPAGAAGPGYIVIQYNTDNPGVWPLHCHIAWHVSGGLYVNTIEQDKGIEQRNLPPVVKQTCQDWGAYTGRAVVDMIDSGLKERIR